MTADTTSRPEKQDRTRVRLVPVMRADGPSWELPAREEARFKVSWQPPHIAMTWTGEVLRGGTRRWRLRYLIGFDA